jgi:threonine/homoserine/homoserine lactone efflux protein
MLLSGVLHVVCGTWVGIFCYVLAVGTIHNITLWGTVLSAIGGILFSYFAWKLWKLI